METDTSLQNEIVNGEYDRIDTWWEQITPDEYFEAATYCTTQEWAEIGLKDDKENDKSINE